MHFSFLADSSVTLRRKLVDTLYITHTLRYLELQVNDVYSLLYFSPDFLQSLITNFINNEKELFLFCLLNLLSTKILLWHIYVMRSWLDMVVQYTRCLIVLCLMHSYYLHEPNSLYLSMSWLWFLLMYDLLAHFDANTTTKIIEPIRAHELYKQQ